jgi:phosphoribosylaminoimidazole (AIR) synthetase
MGIGMIVICGKESAAKMQEALPGALSIGRVIKANGSEKVIVQ